ncbi:hypothetical protein BD414DRAFT_496240 [Trametes punicea]|nr:hypothetical protein BD414DRAFT_496240 [Trametes punicea]
MTVRRPALRVLSAADWIAQCSSAVSRSSARDIFDVVAVGHAGERGSFVSFLGFTCWTLD